jgi:hypothetical protein
VADEDAEIPDDWDFEHAERRRPVRKPRAVVSVAFSREDFERLTEVAEKQGLRTSEFIRIAALARLRSGVTEAHFVLDVGERRDDVYLGTPSPQSQSLSRQVEVAPPDTVTVTAAIAS